MKTIETKPHEDLEFQNRITMFELFYNDMWLRKPKDVDLDTISKTYSHLLIVENDEEGL